MLDKMISIFTSDITPDQKKFLIRISFRFLLVFHIAWACGWLSMMGLQGFAKAGEAQTVKNELSPKIDALVRNQNVQTRSAMESELRRLDQEIFNAETRALESNNNQDLARLLAQRAAELRSDRQRVQQRLESFLNAHPEIAGVAF